MVKPVCFYYTHVLAAVAAAGIFPADKVARDRPADAVLFIKAVPKSILPVEYEVWVYHTPELGYRLVAFQLDRIRLAPSFEVAALGKIDAAGVIAVFLAVLAAVALVAHYVASVVADDVSGT